MKTLSLLFFGLAGLIHIGFFILESFLFQRANGYKYFKLPAEDHQASKIWAYNQGYYNLFLACGILVSIRGFILEETWAQVLVSFCALSMIGAGAVLFASSPKLMRGALIQTLPPVLGLIFLFLK